MKTLWIAADGSKYVIEGNSVKECKEAIDRLRKILNKEKPDIEHLCAMDEQTKAECQSIEYVIQEEDLSFKMKQFLDANLKSNLEEIEPKHKN